ncbi:hypothetical protein V8F33_008964 [Rhypophila sp. PSN 637]
MQSLDLRATDPRDNIYALLGLGQETHVPGKIPQPLLPDYSKPISHVYADFTRWWIETYQSSAILSAGQAEAVYFDGSQVPTVRYHFRKRRRIDVSNARAASQASTSGQATEFIPGLCPSGTSCWGCCCSLSDGCLLPIPAATLTKTTKTTKSRMTARRLPGSLKFHQSFLNPPLRSQFIDPKSPDQPPTNFERIGPTICGATIHRPPVGPAHFPLCNPHRIYVA